MSLTISVFSIPSDIQSNIKEGINNTEWEGVLNLEWTGTPVRTTFVGFSDSEYSSNGISLRRNGYVSDYEFENLIARASVENNGEDFIVLGSKLSNIFAERFPNQQGYIYNLNPSDYYLVIYY